MRSKTQLPASATLVHRTPILVRFSEVDSMRIVWHGTYVRYFEDGREDFGRRYAGLGYPDIHRSGFGAPVVDLQIRYKLPLRLGDRAEVETRYVPTEAAKIVFEYVIRRMPEGDVVAEGSSVQVFTDGDGRLQLTAPDFYNEWKKRWNIR